MERIYLIIRQDFDNLENTDAVKPKIMGYAETEQHATEIVKALEMSEPKYKGWDFSWTKKEYPQFLITPIKKYCTNEKTNN